MMLVMNDMVVFVMDLSMILSFGVMGPFASRNGLKLRMVDTILNPIEALLRTRVAKLLRVAVTISASLHLQSGMRFLYKYKYLPTCYCLEARSIGGRVAPMLLLQDWMGESQDGPAAPRPKRSHFVQVAVALSMVRRDGLRKHGYALEDRRLCLAFALVLLSEQT